MHEEAADDDDRESDEEIVDGQREVPARARLFSLPSQQIHIGWLGAVYVKDSLFYGRSFSRITSDPNQKNHLQVTPEMNSSAAMPVLVDSTDTSNEPSDSATACMREMLIQRPIAMRNNMFCMHPQVQTQPYDRPSRRLPIVPRRPQSSNPVITELMNTVAQARDRKRRREEALYTRRNVGQQTDREGLHVEETTVIQESFDTEPEISATKRVRREEVEHYPRNSNATFESIGTNTISEPLTFPPIERPTLTVPSTDNQPSSSTSSSGQSSSTSVAAAEAARQKSLSRQQARRATRLRRSNQETLRVQLENNPTGLLQQISGLVPGNDHNCDTRCPHFQQQNSSLHHHHHHHPHHYQPTPLTGPHAVSPTIAPAAMHYRSPLAPSNFYYPYSTMPTNLHVPMVMGVMIPMAVPQPPPPPPPQPQVHAPIPQFPSLYALRNNPMTTFSTVAHEHIAELIRLHNSIMYPSLDRYGVDRFHMFQGMELDVPIGATRIEIDSFTKAVPYKKLEGEEEDETCTVCLSTFEDGESIQKLPCKHYFHPECIYKWLDINKRCPVCREEIDRHRILPIPGELNI